MIGIYSLLANHKMYLLKKIKLSKNVKFKIKLLVIKNNELKDQEINKMEELIENFK